jgi:uncharacterized protein (TIGR02271 family)
MSSDAKQPINDSSESKGTADLKVMPVIQEFVRVGKQTVETGRVIATKSVKEEVADISVTLNRDDLSIERIPIGEYIESDAPESRYEGDTLIIPVVKEELVIQKRLVLIEEIRITKRRATTELNEQVTLRKEEVEIRTESNNELKT